MVYLQGIEEDKAAGRQFIWNITQASRQKFQFQDRIHKDDVAGIIGQIANYISQKASSSNPDIPVQADALFWGVLCPKVSVEWDKNNGYRLNPDTLNAAGDQVGTLVNQFMTGQPGVIPGVSTGKGIFGLLKNPWVLGGAAVVVVLAVTKGKFIKGLLKGHDKIKITK